MQCIGTITPNKFWSEFRVPIYDTDTTPYQTPTKQSLATFDAQRLKE